MAKSFMSSSCCSAFAGKRTRQAKSVYRSRMNQKREAKKTLSQCDEGSGQKSGIMSSRYVGTNVELRKAISSISEGCSCSDQYTCRSGIYQLKLKVAQSWKDRGVPYKTSVIMGLGYGQLRSELGYGSSVSGRFFY
jgi:hypothetical protein